MTFRRRLLLGLGAIALLPLAIMTFGVRAEMAARLTGQYEQRATSRVGSMQRRLHSESEMIAGRLAGLRGTIVNDNRFRLAAVQDVSSERPYLLDYAQRALRVTGLDMLQIQDATGRIVTSGHFRNEYDREEPDLLRRLLAAGDGPLLVRARAPEGPFIALVRLDSFSLATQRFTLVGGIAVNRRLLRQLAGGPEAEVFLWYPGGVLSSETPGPERGAAARADLAGGVSWAALRDSLRGTAVVRDVPIAYLDTYASLAATAGSDDEAHLTIAYSLLELRALERRVDRWFLAVGSGTAITVLLLALWLASRLSRPLTTLARKTAAVDLDRLDVEFGTDRRDEIGDLSRLLGSMTARLRASAARLRDVERRAAMGEMARQVNHDIKNGLTPIRNIVQHLAQVAEAEPQQLDRVFRERRRTLESSIEYLATLAAKYARLTPPLDRRPCDLNAVVREVVQDADSGDRAAVTLELGADTPLVAGEVVALRRILENLVGNALDSLGGTPGTVTVTTARVADPGAPRARVVVADTGRGMTGSELDRAFDDFYTTKPGGTGLGLTIVRRLVMDLDGSLRVQSMPGAGTRIDVELPAAQARGTADAGPEQTPDARGAPSREA